MAITTTSRQTAAFTSGNGFAFEFKVFDTSDVKVIQIDTTTKVETVLTLTSNYTVALNDDQDANPGGTVTLVSGGNPQNLGSGLNIVITSKVEAKQQTELTNQGGFFPEVINDALDKAVILLQQQQAVLDKTIKFPLTNSVSGLEITANPTTRAKKVLSFDSSGNLDVQQEIGTFKGNWAASTGYVIRDIVKDTSTNNIFICNTAHTSTGAQPLTTNANSANWDLIVDAATATTSSTNAASSATAAATSATASATSATAAATSETNAASSATTATTKATQADTAKTAAETAKTAAETAKTAAETALDTFDDRYLGVKSSDPSVDNDGDALLDGALYFNTTDNVTKVYDSGNSAWVLLKISDANQAKINTVEASIANVNTVGGAIANVNAVAANATNINNVAGNSSNINTVANNNTNVNTVAGNNANVSTVATDITSVNTVAAEINNNNLQTVASNINAVTTAADDLNEATSEIDTVANAITNVDTVGTNISNVNTVAGISSDVTTVSGNNSNVTAVANNSSNINSAVSNASNINAAVANQTNINAAVGNATDISAVAGNNSNITAVAGNATNINAVKNNETNINAVNANKTNIDAVAGNNSNVTAVANNQSNINAVAADASDIGIVAADGTHIGLVAGSIGNVNTTAGSIGNVNTVANNIANVSSFAGTYQIASSDPSVDGAGNSLSEGDLYFNSSINELKVYDGSAWQSGVTNINNFLAKAGGQMTGNITFSGSQTVDGRDVSADGTKLDTIESNAKDDQTASEIKTLLNSDGIVNAQIDGSAAIAGTKISPDFGSQNVVTTGNLDIGDLPNTTNNALMKIAIQDTDGVLKSDNTIRINPNQDALHVNDLFLSSNHVRAGSNGPLHLTTANANGTVDLKINTTHVEVNGNLLSATDSTDNLGSSGVRWANIYSDALNVAGDITITGTVDGVDIAARNTLFGGLTSSSGVLSNGVTATTQSASDNSTKVATTAYADTAISNLIDSSPGTLNTLNELAAALGDDANFSTTITNSIATKLPLAGGNLTGGLGVSGDITVTGTVDGIDIAALSSTVSGITTNATHSGEVTGSGALTIADNIVDEANLKVSNSPTNGYFLSAQSGNTGGLTWANVDLSSKLSLTGGNLTGTLGTTVIEWSTQARGNDDCPIYLGTNNDLKIHHNGSASIVETGHNGQTLPLHIKGEPIELYHSGSKKFETTASGWNSFGSYHNFYGGVSGTNVNANITLRSTGTAVYQNLFFYNSAGNSYSYLTGYGGGSILFYGSNEHVWAINNQGERMQLTNTALSPRTDGQTALGTTSKRWGDVHADAATINGTCTATTFSGSGASLTSLPSAQLTGALPAISGASLTSLNASNISSGTIAAARVATLNQDTSGTAEKATRVIVTTSSDSTSHPLIVQGATGNLTPHTSSNYTFNATSGVLSCTGFSGSGASLTSLAANQLSSGTVPTARLGSGTASNSTYLRGDNTWATVPSAYTDSSVDTHLNTGGASSSEVLSWNGSDYAWVTQSGGGGTPGGSNTQLQYNSSGSFGGSSNLTFDGTNLSVGGTVSATSSASGTAGMRKVTASTSNPSGGSDGDVWIKYT